MIRIPRRLVRVFHGLVLTGLIACGSSPAPAVVTEPSTTTPAPPTSSPAPFALHEWGLVDVAANGSVELAAGPGTTRSIPEPPPEGPPIHVRKPVIYAQLLDGAASVTFSLRADVPSGRIVESWPDAVVSGDHLSWPSVEARTCAGARRAAVRDAAPACRSLDGVCEVLDLPRYEAAGASCLAIDGSELAHPLLFYRADLPRLALPAVVTRDPGRTITVRADGAIAGAELVRIVRSRGTVAVSRARVPSRGESITIPAPSSIASESDERANLVASVIALGLSAGEGQAFAEAWTTELFGRRAAREGGPALDDVVLYFLPEETIARIAPLTVTPAPRELRRVWLVRVELLN